MPQSINLDPGEEIEITGTNLFLPDVSRTKIVVKSRVKGGVKPPPPPVEPPPEPEPKPGAVVFSEGFETFPGAWVADKGLFTQGNTKTHGIPPSPAMGEHSLRMKLAIGAPDPGKFPPGGSDTIRLTLKLPKPGKYRLTRWGVAHDTGEVAFEVLAEGAVAASIYGTDGLNELEWLPTSVDFETLTGDVELQISYTAPATIDAESGHKIALIEIVELE